MKKIRRTIGVAIVSMGLMLTTVYNVQGRLIIPLPYNTLAQYWANYWAKKVTDRIKTDLTKAQQAYLQQNSPHTWNTITNNYAVYARTQPPSTPPAVTSPPPPPATTSQMQPITVDDIKALTTAGVKKDVIIQEIGESKTVYSPSDISAAQQVNPPIAQEVIECMKNHPS